MAHSTVVANRKGPPEYASGRSAAFTHASDDYLQSPSAEAGLQGFGNTFTWSLWWKFTANGLAGEFPRPMRLVTATNDNNVNLLWDEFERISMVLRDTSGSIIKQYISPVETVSTWYHYVWTWNGTDMLVYRDAVDITNTTVNKFIDGSGTRADASGYWLFGTLGSQRWAGKIYSPAVWNTVLTSAEVTEIFNTASTNSYSADFGNYVSSSSLVHYWDFRRIHDPLNDRAGDMHLFDSSITPDDTDVPV